jgi:hypothetical protein
VKLELERAGDAEVATAAADGPEKVRVSLGARPQEAAVGKHEVNGTNVVERHATRAHQPTQSSTERQPAVA